MKQSAESDPHDITTLGCGSNLVTPSTITLYVNTTTGGNFTVAVEYNGTIENLKKVISKKLKVPKGRICLLHRERELLDGTLKDNGLVDGSKVILIPNVETGLLAQRPENSVMQALESLNDTQVNDFLSGKSPLNLSMRLGDHMMLIQLQLSTLNATSSTASSSSSNSTFNPSSDHQYPSGSRTRSSSSKMKLFESSSSSLASTSSTTNNTIKQNLMDTDTDRTDFPDINTPSTSSVNSLPTSSTLPTASSSSTISRNAELNNLLIKRELENYQNILKSLTELQHKDEDIRSDETVALEQSPIKSLSNLVSNSITTSQIFTPSSSKRSSAITPCLPTDPISAKLTSCLCKTYENDSNNISQDNCQLHSNNQSNNSTQNTLSPTISPSTTTQSHHRRKCVINTIRKNKLKNNFSLLKKAFSQLDSETLSILTNQSNINSNNSNAIENTEMVTEGSETTATAMDSAALATSTTQIPDTRALAEASRNLTQTLRKLSKEVFTNKIDVKEDSSHRMGTGAVIESMKHHGKGIYSGTFSGTLNPALQDRYGRPKRDISTIIYILNDLLSATPQYKRNSKTQVDQSLRMKNSNKELLATSDFSNIQSQSDTTDTCLNCAGKSNTKNLKCTNSDCSEHIENTESLLQLSSTTGERILKSSDKNLTTITNDKTTLNKDETSALGLNVSCRCNSSSDINLNNCVDHNSSSSSSTSSISTERIKCNRIEAENNKTKCKLNHLRFIMQQNKQRREARKMKNSPYNSSARVVNTTTTTLGLPPNHITEEVDSVA